MKSFAEETNNLIFPFEYIENIIIKLTNKTISNCILYKKSTENK